MVITSDLNNSVDVTNVPAKVPASANRLFQRWRRNPLAVGAAFGLLELSGVGVKNELGWIDPVTGSEKNQTRYLGFPTSTRIRRSAIEDWINRRESRHLNTWAHLHNTSKTLFGRPVVFSCGRAPEIYVLHAGDLNDDFVRSSSDDVLAEFIKVVRTGTESEKRQTVEAYALKALASN